MVAQSVSLGKLYVGDQEVWAANFCGTFSFRLASPEDLKPVRVIYNPPMTICYFCDGSKVTVKTMDGEEFTKEGGVQACIIKKLYGNHNEFKRVVENGYVQPKKVEKKA